MQWMVKVGTDKETAKGEFAEFAGFAYWGPFTMDQAYAFERLVQQEFLKQAQEDPGSFVYGNPVTEVLPLDDREDTEELFGIRGRVYAAARNWWTDPAGVS